MPKELGGDYIGRGTPESLTIAQGANHFFDLMQGANKLLETPRDLDLILIPVAKIISGKILIQAAEDLEKIGNDRAVDVARNIHALGQDYAEDASISNRLPRLRETLGSVVGKLYQEGTLNEEQATTLNQLADKRYQQLRQLSDRPVIGARLENLAKTQPTGIAK